MARRIYGVSTGQVAKEVTTEETKVQSSLEETKKLEDLASVVADESPKPSKRRRTYGSAVIPTPVEEEQPTQVSIDVYSNDEISDILARRNKRRKIRFIVVSSIFLVIIGVCGFFALKYHKEDVEVTQMWDDIRNTAYVPTEEQTYTATIGNQALESGLAYPNDPMDRLINWDALKAVNADVLCWVYIPGTSIDYPVLQEKNIGEFYYLDHDIYGKYRYSGSILTPKETEGAEDAHLTIYGHHMANGTMFGSLTKYKDESYYKEHPYVYIYYPDRTERWIVWSAYRTDKDDDIYYMPYVRDSQEYAALIMNIESKRLYKTAAGSVNNTMPTLTLSTCNNYGGSHDRRFVVTSIISDVKWLDNQARIDYEMNEQERQDAIDAARQERNRNGENVDHYIITYDGGND